MALTDNLRAYYKLEDANDSTANAYNLTNTGSVSFASAGKIGNSAGTFNTGSQRLGRTDAMGFTSTSTNTWSFWVKFTAVGGYQIDICTTSGANKRVLIYGDSANGRMIAYANATDNIINTGNSSVTTGTWYHVVLTHNSGLFELFLNGVSKGTSSPGGTGGASNYLSYGNPGDSFGAPLNGYLDEAGVWDRVLSGTEITQLYNSGAGLQYPFVNGYSPVAWLHA